MPGWVLDHPCPTGLPLLTIHVGSRLVAYQDQVGLSSQQLAQILGRIKQYRQALYPAQKAMLDKADEVAVALHGPTVDVPTAYQLVDEYTALCNGGLRLMVDVADDILSVLTTQQFAALEQIYDSEKSVCPSLPPGATHGG